MIIADADYIKVRKIRKKYWTLTQLWLLTGPAVGWTAGGRKISRYTGKPENCETLEWCCFHGMFLFSAK